MSITIFDNLLFFPQGAKVVSLETKNFLHFLLEDTYFQNELKTLRKKYKIPEDGYHLKQLYESVEIRDEVIDELSFEKLEQFHRLLDEIFRSNDYLFAPEDKAAEVVNKKKGKLDQFYNSLSQDEKKGVDRYSARQKADAETDFKRKKEQKGFSTRKLQKSMQADLKRLVAHYKLTSNFESQFFMLIAFNAFQNIIPFDPFLFMETKEDILDEIQKSKEPIGALLIYEQVTKNQLIKWIEDNWNIIKDHMQELPKTTFQKSTILDISKEIADLRDKQSMTYPDIADYLAKKYPDDQRVKDESWIKATYKRYKNRLQAFSHKV